MYELFPILCILEGMLSLSLFLNEDTFLHF